MASLPSPTRLSPSPSGARRTIATYSSYEEAERAVDLLSDQRFPVERVAIVGTGLRSVEQVVGRVTTGRAALTGAGQGALIGLFIALLFGLFLDGPEFLGLLAYAVITGAIFGAVLLGDLARGAGRATRLRVHRRNVCRPLRAASRRGGGRRGARGCSTRRRPEGPLACDRRQCVLPGWGSSGWRAPRALPRPVGCRMRGAGSCGWRVSDPTPEEMEELRLSFGLPALAVEDAQEGHAASQARAARRAICSSS